MKSSLISLSTLLVFLLPALGANSSCAEKQKALEVAASENSGERCFASKLTSGGWRFLRGDGAFAEGYSYQFLPDGTYRWNVISDYSESRGGQWNYKKVSDDEGLVFLLAQNNVGHDAGGSQPRQSVLYCKCLTDGKLLLAGDVLEPVKSSAQQAARPAPVALPDIIKQTNFPDYFRLVSHRWKKQGVKDDDFIPDLLSLRDDGTFVAQFRNGACTQRGHWSLKKELLLEIAPNDCDLRGYKGASTRSQRYRLDGETLVLNEQYIYQRSAN
ncbi:MAG TPA: hypothetical protein VGV59_18310 [Pyrinomonadaceae bacterium]|nr:hypothetical protein [Pyrinomonadaceae bacterium]